jgi:hypothetical protein
MQSPLWDVKNISNAVIIAFIIELSALLLEAQNEYFRYKRPAILFDALSYINYKIISFKIKKSLENEDQRKYYKELIFLAINNIESSEKQKKINGLTQLYQLGRDSDYTLFIYHSLKRIYCTEKDKSFKPILLEALYKFHKLI